MDIIKTLNIFLTLSYSIFGRARFYFEWISWLRPQTFVVVIGPVWKIDWTFFFWSLPMNFSFNFWAKQVNVEQSKWQYASMGIKLNGNFLKQPIQFCSHLMSNEHDMHTNRIRKAISRQHIWRNFCWLSYIYMCVHLFANNNNKNNVDHQTKQNTKNENCVVLFCYVCEYSIVMFKWHRKFCDSVQLAVNVCCPIHF